ncbi:MAG: SLC13/DASS family transporter [Succinivibrio sp.]|nr:SLC13/DASS family transporter [Succinivibrio sp.]
MGQKISSGGDMDDAVITLIVLGVVSFLFITELIPIAITALSATVVLALCGVLTTKEAFSGFSNSTVILFAGMFVVGAAMLDSGLAQAIGNYVVRKVGTNEVPLMIALMIVTIFMSAFASNTGTVACLLPMVIGICVSAKIPCSALLMGLAVAANTGCNLTMVGTPPNMLANAALENAGFPMFGFFEFTIIGGPIALCCLVFMVTVGRKMLPRHKAELGAVSSYDGPVGSSRQRWEALLILAFVIAGLIIGIPGVSPSMVAVIGALVCVLSGCITEKQAYQGIDWVTIFLFAGMLPIATALEKTGAGQMVAETVVGFMGENPSGTTIMAVLFLLSCGLTQFMPNTATAALLIPIGLSISQQINASPLAVTMGITIAASCSFATPVATPPNTLIMTPGGFHFVDYIKVGLPMCLISFVLCVLIVPVAWPFH